MIRKLILLSLLGVVGAAFVNTKLAVANSAYDQAQNVREWSERAAGISEPEASQNAASQGWDRYDSPAPAIPHIPENAVIDPSYFRQFDPKPPSLREYPVPPLSSN